MANRENSREQDELSQSTEVEEMCIRDSYGFVPLYAAWFIANVLWIRASFDPAVKQALK